MWRSACVVALAVAFAGAVLAHIVFAQNAPDPGPGQLHRHGAMPSHGGDMGAQHTQATRDRAGTVPAPPGQDAFGAIAEVVGILDADPNTDWTKVDLERLRQHLIE